MLAPSSVLQQPESHSDRNGWNSLRRIQIEHGKAYVAQNDSSLEGQVDSWAVVPAAANQAISVRRAMLNHDPLGTAASPPIMFSTDAWLPTVLVRVCRPVLRRSRWQSPQ